MERWHICVPSKATIPARPIFSATHRGDPRSRRDEGGRAAASTFHAVAGEVPMISNLLRMAALAALTTAISASTASAHCYVGGRFLPATLAIDDPCVADEL